MQHRCISFESYPLDALSQQIDEWLETEASDIEIVSMQYQFAYIKDYDGENPMHTALIIYKYTTT